MCSEAEYYSFSTLAVEPSVRVQCVFLDRSKLIAEKGCKRTKKKKKKGAGFFGDLTQLDL